MLMRNPVNWEIAAKCNDCHSLTIYLFGTAWRALRRVNFFHAVQLGAAKAGRAFLLLVRREFAPDVVGRDGTVAG